MIGAAINLILNFALIPYYNIYGAAIASIISSFVIMFLYYYYSQREYYIKYEISRLVIIIASSTLLISTIYFINIESVIITIILKSTLLISYPFILLLFGFFTKSEKEKLVIIAKNFPNIGKIKQEITSN